MTDEHALLAAIAANPDDDTVRLAYADWLDENGGESNAGRAEFIRLSTLFPRLPLNSPERSDTRVRLDRLLLRWDFVWQRQMPEGFRNLSGNKRGLPYRAAAIASAIVPGADDHRTLLIEELELTVDVPPSTLRDVVIHRLFMRLKVLTLRTEFPLGIDGTRALAEGEFRQLERLILERQNIGDLGLKSLCESSGFPRLRHLHIRDNSITDEGGTTLLESSLVRKLTRFDVWTNALSPPIRDQLNALVRSVGGF